MRYLRPFLLLAVASCVACGGTDAEGAPGPSGTDGAQGTSCSITDNGDGTKTIACEDGTSVDVLDGDQGTTGSTGDVGATGTTGDAGLPGMAGSAGTSCSITDNGDGSKTIDCEDGTSVLVSDGAQGADGVEGADGVTGSSGPTCITTVDTDGVIQSISCSDGIREIGSVALEPVADGHTGLAHSETQLEVNHRLPSAVYLRFDLSGIPEKSSILSARLTMTAYTGCADLGDGNVYVRRVEDDTWAEDTLYEDLPPPVADDEPLGYWYLWYACDAPSVQIGTVSTNALQDAVRVEYEGDGVISLQLHSPGYWTSYRPREWSDETQRPQLEIQYAY